MISALLLISSNRSIVTIDTKGKRDKKPNIIFILSDDHNAFGIILPENEVEPNQVSKINAYKKK